MARTARGVFPLADKAGDEPTADLLTQRLTVHEQTAWMLRSLLESSGQPGAASRCRRVRPTGRPRNGRSRQPLAAGWQFGIGACTVRR